MSNVTRVGICVLEVSNVTRVSRVIKVSRVKTVGICVMTVSNV